MLHLADDQTEGSFAIQLEGDLWWSSPAQGRVVLHDATGTAELEMTLENPMGPVGRRVRISGHGTVMRRGAAIRLGAKGPVVDNDGIHSMLEKSGAVYLRAGRQPIRVEWFNGVEKSGLEVNYEGPDLPRQQVPDEALSRRVSVSPGEPSVASAGLDYRCYEVTSEALPDFSQLTPIRSGITPNFNFGITEGREHEGALFTGYLDVPADGLYTFHLKSDDGSRLFVGQSTLRMEDLGPAKLPTPRSIAIGQLLHDGEANQWAELDGRVTFVRWTGAGCQAELRAGAGQVRLEIADRLGLSSVLQAGNRVNAVGFCESARTTEGQRVPGVLLVPGQAQIKLLENATDHTVESRSTTNTLPLLTTAAEVHQLKREEAEHGYPVRIRGVVTSVLPEHQAFTLQDATRGIYVVNLAVDRAAPVQIGDFLEVEGHTDPSLFAPIVNANQVTSLGAGQLPEPVRPNWDQLLNGSLDAQYVELQGIVSSVHPGGVTLLTREGRIQVELRVTGLKPDGLQRYDNALVRIRGCLFATWDYVTHQVKVGEIRIYGADILVDQAAPTDLFSTPRKTAAELLLFDPQAGLFQRVKVAGQIVGVQDQEYFMMDGTRGLRIITKEPADLRVGDLAEAVGFLELSGNASPLLREAVARKTGHAALPQPVHLRTADLIRADHDATRVRVDGLLAGIRKTPVGEVLEMQSGVRTFIARLDGGGETDDSLPVGSQLQLTGVYAAVGGNRLTGQAIGSFELLLGSPRDVVMLARPPWWTLERLLVIVGVLVGILTATILWITQLRRQVEDRTAELGRQIHKRQRVEHQHALEQERARIAQDLHDELGSGITEIGMLAARARSGTAPGERRNRHLDQVGDKAREMVTALDEIVWAMNPRHDSLASLVSYLNLYADRFLGLANIHWQLEGAEVLPDLPLDSRRRHQVFLAFKEALTNVVRHSGADQVKLTLRVASNQLRVTITDNGHGLPAEAPTEAMDGVANMRARMEKLGGVFAIEGGTAGTTVELGVPLN